MSNFVVDFSPTILSLGPVQLRWYSLMYVIGYVMGGQLAKKLVREGFFKVPEKQVDELVTTLFIGMLLGARFFYVVIYNWSFYKSQSFTEMFAIWHGGLSFHGAIVGFIIAGFVFAKRNNVSWFQVMDVLTLVGTPGLFFGRLGNFMNGELYGRVSDVPWAMIFPAGGPSPRHPSQIYEALTEGLILAIIVWVMYKKKLVKSYGIIAFTFCVGYGVFRFIVEFFREADAQLGYYFNGMFTMGQILCFIMIIFGTIGILYSKKAQIEN